MVSEQTNRKVPSLISDNKAKISSWADVGLATKAKRVLKEF